MASFMSPPPKATCLAFHPQDNNVIAVGLDDTSVRIYDIRINTVIERLGAHSERITGLAFSDALHALVTAGADSQIVVWGSECWEKRRSCYVHSQNSKSPEIQSNTQLQFHPDQTHILIAHELLIAIYDISDLLCSYEWVPEASSPLMMQAVLSATGDKVFAFFSDGVISVFATAGLYQLCRIKPAAYLPPNVISGSVVVKAVAANPQEPNMLALGLSDGSVVVLEPLDANGGWGAPPTPPQQPVVAAPVKEDPVDQDVKPMVIDE